VTTCELTTYAPDEDEDTNAVAFEPSSIVSNVIMKVATKTSETDDRVNGCILHYLNWILHLRHWC